jgi:alpha-mannosidase
MIAIQDNKTQFVVVTDVSQGGASLSKGEVELMVHRRVQADDSRGVQEPLNETMCGCNDIGASPGRMGEHGHEGDGGCECAGLTMRGRHWLYFGLIEDANQARRRMIEELNFPSTLAFASGAITTAQPSYSAIAKAFPDNVKLTTLTSNYAAFNDGALMLRVAHLYSVGEHPTLSAPATISFADIFAKAGLTITSMRETTLSGNQDKAEWEAKKLHWQTNAPVKSESYVAFDPTDSALSVTLRPMEVRTFLVNFNM